MLQSGDLDVVGGVTLAPFLVGHNLQGWAGDTEGVGLSHNCTSMLFVSCSCTAGREPRAPTHTHTHTHTHTVIQNTTVIRKPRQMSTNDRCIVPKRR
jgi:hypothetical protein